MTTTAAPSMQTLARTFAEIQSRVPGYPWVPLGNFLMEFFRHRPEHQAELLSAPIQEQPQAPGIEASEEEKEVHQWAVFCAASVEYLSRCCGLDCPSWVHHPAYARLSEPWYFAPMAYKKEQVRERAELTTPEEFARKNIFCGSKVYVDKYAEAQKFLASRQLRKTA